MSEESLKVLEMVASGRVTPEQANQLLEALAGPRPQPEPRPGRAPAADGRPDRFLAGLTAEQLIEMRQHGLSAAFVQEMRGLGFVDLDLDQMIELRDHGVSAGYVREMRELDLGSFDVDALIELRDHGVTPAFIREMRDLGLGELSIDQIVELRDNGVDSAFIEEMRQVQVQVQQAARADVTA